MFDYGSLVMQLLDEEGNRLKPYTDATGHITIGVGRNLSERGISAPESLLLLANDIDSALHDLNAAYPWWKTLDDVRSRVLISMCFNMGIGELQKFDKFEAALKAGDFARASAEMRNSAWYYQVGIRGVKLVRWMQTGATRIV